MDVVAGQLQRRHSRPWRVVRWITSVVSAATGLFVAFISVALGSCSGSGGRCPSPGLEGDVFGGVATGLVMAVGVPLVAWRPDRRGVAIAVGVVIPVAAVIGLLVAKAVT